VTDRNRLARLPEIELAKLARSIDGPLNVLGRGANGGRISRR
jgi:hypothetical protein